MVVLLNRILVLTPDCEFVVRTYKKNLYRFPMSRRVRRYAWGLNCAREKPHAENATILLQRDSGIVARLLMGPTRPANQALRNAISENIDCFE